MARTPTTIIPLGFKAPAFELFDTVSGKNTTLDELKGEKGTVIMFICNHCPFVIHIRPELIRLANDYLSKGIKFIAISSNDVTQYPEDSPEKMAELSKSENFPFPYLYDETQEIAKAYSAACTPDFSIFDKDLVCVYRGQLDDSRPGNEIPVTGKDIRNALSCLIENKIVNTEQKPSLGCNIKWK
jgi:thiol-disulfide isomerase/thioredoxin